MADEETTDTAEEEEELHDVHITVCFSGGDRRTIFFNKMPKGQIQGLMQTVSKSFDTVRVNGALMLSGSDGLVQFINIDNANCIEVRIV